MNKKLIHLCSIALLFLHSSFAAAVTFSGSVSLPAGVNAPSSGVTVQVSTFPIDFRFNGLSFSSSTDTVIIAPGTSSANYTFEVSDGFSGGNVKLTFECGQDCTGLAVTSDGSVDAAGVAPLISGSDFSTNSNQAVNINLEAATVFSGFIQFPQGLSASGNEFFSLRARSQAQFSFISYSSFISATQGQTSIPFSLGVPLDDGNSGWSIELGCLECQAPLINEGFFATTATGDPLSTAENLAFLFSNNRNFTGMQLTLLRESPQDQSAGSTIAPILLLLDD